MSLCTDPTHTKGKYIPGRADHSDPIRQHNIHAYHTAVGTYTWHILEIVLP